MSEVFPDNTGAESVEVMGKSGVQGQGPFMYMNLACQGDTVSRAWFETYGCPSAIRCGDWVTKWAVGRKVESLAVLEASDLITVVGGLPLGKEFCAGLAVDSLRDCLAALNATQKGS